MCFVIKKKKKKGKKEINKYENQTFESQEKYPSLIEMAGSPGSRVGFGARTLSSVKNSCSRRCIDTCAVTTY